jgi:hypothetical protein
MAISCAYAALFLPSPQASSPHETLHPMLATDDPLPLQLGMDTWTTIDPSAQVASSHDLCSQPLILPLALAWFALAPGVVAAFGHVQDTTHRFHGVLLIMLCNKDISLFYVFENTIKAFFKMSRSWRVTSNSRLRRRSSSSWAV